MDQGHDLGFESNPMTQLLEDSFVDSRQPDTSAGQEEKIRAPLGPGAGAGL